MKYRFTNGRGLIFSAVGESVHAVSGLAGGATVFLATNYTN